MWLKIARLILVNRLAILITLGVITALLGYQGTKCEIQYSFSKLLPNDDPTAITYNNFRKQYGANDNVLIISSEDSSLFKLEKFQALYHFTKELQKTPAVDSVFSIANFYVLRRNKEENKFLLQKAVPKPPTSQEEVNDIKRLMYDEKFYEGLLWKDDASLSILAITMDSDTLESSGRNEVVLGVHEKVEAFAKVNNIKFHYSGLPYVRSKISTLVEAEINVFLYLAAIVTALILFFFLRSFKAMFFSMVVVFVGVTWSFGVIATLGYKITILSSLIPPLIIVIGIPNCIFLLNKYFSEYKNHKNQAKALARIISKIGNATFLTNLTTALCFATFALTNSSMLFEFGVVAFLCIMSIFLLSILIIPIVYSYLPAPKAKHMGHLDKKWTNGLIKIFTKWVLHKRPVIYIITVIFVLIGLYGSTMIETKGYIVDEIPHDDPIKVDLRFFEKNFNGMIPFEILIKSEKKTNTITSSNLKKIEKLYKAFEEDEELKSIFSKPKSILDVVKYTKQAYYNGNPNEYSLPRRGLEEGSINEVAKNSREEGDNILSSFVNDGEIRISLAMKDVGSGKVNELQNKVTALTQTIFKPSKYSVDLTGTSIVYAKGTNLLVSNLMISLVIAIILIALIMLYLFKSFKMVIISLLPNLIPLIVTCAIMGFFNIPIKPSTILVFSIAFGISVDDSIHYLAKYRQELKTSGMNIGTSVVKALRETGISMFYTSIVLFFGFSIFTTSKFGGTVALGILVSITLLIAMLANLVLLPSLLLTLEKSIISKEEKKLSQND